MSINNQTKIRKNDKVLTLKTFISVICHEAKQEKSGILKKKKAFVWMKKNLQISAPNAFNRIDILVHKSNNIFFFCFVCS